MNGGINIETIILSAKDVTKSFGMGKMKTNILKNISVDFYENDFTVIMGASGAGKSTLLYVISGMENASKGSVQYKGKELTKLNEKHMAILRSEDFGFVFQQANLVSNLTLEENVCISGYMKKGNNQKSVKKKSEELLKKMNVMGARHRLPSEVSGGEAQRTAVARALINMPKVIFADEPTGALNKQNTVEVLDLLGKVHEEGHSIIMVTHDVHAAIRANRILYIEDGYIKGEINLSNYSNKDAKAREVNLLEWLATMEW